MKIILAPNAFKECLTAPEVAEAMAEGVRKANPDAHIIKLPLADGGDGTRSLLVNLTHACPPPGRRGASRPGRFTATHSLRPDGHAVTEKTGSAHLAGQPRPEAAHCRPGAAQCRRVRAPIGDGEITAPWSILGTEGMPSRALRAERSQCEATNLTADLPAPPVARLALWGGGQAGARRTQRNKKGLSLRPLRLCGEKVGEDIAIIEMAEAAGLKLIPPSKRNPLLSHTYGVGQLIQAILDRGTGSAHLAGQPRPEAAHCRPGAAQCRRVRQIMIGLGGSATIEGGVGMAQCLGIKFLDKKGQVIGLGGGALANLAHIDASGLDPRIKDTKIWGLCDTYLPAGLQAWRTFSPQKGASPAQVKFLADNLTRLYRIIKNDLGINVKNIKGGGAAGGLGAGLVAFLGARLIEGTRTFLDLINFTHKIKDADLVIVGEGRLVPLACRSLGNLRVTPAAPDNTNGKGVLLTGRPFT